MAKQIALILVFALSVCAQSFSPRQPVDFSAVTTKPIQVGTAAPATCAVGQVYFDSDATAGQNLYLCTATNTWTQLTGTGGSGAGVGVCSTAGTSTAYTCTVSGLTLSAGVVLRIKPHTASGNAPTLNVNGTGAVALYWRNGNAVTTNELSPNWWDITYTGSAWEITETTVGIDTSLTGALSITRSGGLEKIVKGSLLCLTTDACSPTGARVYSASAKTAPFRIGSSDPATCDHTVREAFYNTTLDVVKFCTAANTWTTLTGSGMADPMTTRGDLIYRGASGTTRLALGTNGQCLTSNGTDAVWGSCSATGNVTASGTLTLNAPVIGAGTTAVSVGSRTGNTTEFVTQSGAKTAGKQATYDANGNLIASAYDVGASGSGATSITEYITFSGGIQTGDNDKNHVGFQQISGGPALSVFPASPSPMGTTALPAGVSTEVQIYTVLPPGWTGAISMGLFTSLAANNTGAGTFVLAVRTACATPGTDSMEIASSSMNAVQTITETIAGGAFQYKTGKYSTLTLDTTGCAAGDVLFVRYKRDSTTYTSDNAPDFLLLGFARLAVTRTL
jgi:hypothetical protein